MFRYVNLSSEDITPNFLSDFHHHQIIEKKYVLVGGKWEISDANDIGEWSDEKRVWIADNYLRRQIGEGVLSSQHLTITFWSVFAVSTVICAAIRQNTQI